jgi:hypothetical protein
MTDARLTPWDVIFGPPGFDAARFEMVREHATADDTTSARNLLLVPAAGELLRELLPPDASGVQHSELFDQVGALVFHAYRFWNEGQPVYRIGEMLFRRLLQNGAAGTAVSPGGAGYVQFPRNVIWSRVDDVTPPEPVDGFFFSSPAAAAHGRLDVLLVLGLRQGRPGVSLIDVALEDAATLEQWADIKARPLGADFENILPGGELQMYHAVTLRAEVLKLVALCFRAIGAHPAAARAEGDSRICEIDG